jgi:hypothetical protein
MHRHTYIHYIYRTCMHTHIKREIKTSYPNAPSEGEWEKIDRSNRYISHKSYECVCVLLNTTVCVISSITQRKKIYSYFRPNLIFSLQTYLNQLTVQVLDLKWCPESNSCFLMAPYTLSYTVQFNCVKKTARKTELNILWHSTGFPSGLSAFFCQFCWVPWDDAIVVSAGKLRKLWDSLSELRSFLCERRLEACAIACQNCAVCSLFPSGMTSHSKIAQFNWECTGSLTLKLVRITRIKVWRRRGFNISVLRFYLLLRDWMKAVCSFISSTCSK